MVPSHFKNMNIKILKYDDTVINAMTDDAKKAYLAADANFSSIF